MIIFGGWRIGRPPDGALGLYRHLGLGDAIVYEDDPATEQDEAGVVRRAGRFGWTEQPAALNDNVSAA